MANQQQRQPQPPSTRTTIISVVLFMVVAFFVGSQFMNMSNTTQTDSLITSEFVQAVEQDRVNKVIYNAGDYTVTGTYYPAITSGSTASAAFNSAFDALNAKLGMVKNPLDGKPLTGVATEELSIKTLGTERNYTSTYVGQDSLGQLLAAHPNIQYEIRLPSGLLEVLGTFLPFILLAALLFFFFTQMQKANNSQMSFGKAKTKKTAEERPDVKFSDVAGVDEAVEEMTEIKDFLANPAKYQSMGAKIPRGCLLVGPPGTGKTLLARAVDLAVDPASVFVADHEHHLIGLGHDVLGHREAVEHLVHESLAFLVDDRAVDIVADGRLVGRVLAIREGEGHLRVHGSRCAADGERHLDTVSGMAERVGGGDDLLRIPIPARVVLAQHLGAARESAGGEDDAFLSGNAIGGAVRSLGDNAGDCAVFRNQLLGGRVEVDLDGVVVLFDHGGVELEIALAASAVDR